MLSLICLKMKIIETIQSRKTNTVFLEKINNLEFNNDDKLFDNIVKINTHKSFQTIKGFGGAFTEASAYVLNQLPKEKQGEIMKAYFSKDGLNYNLGRTTINSCDFSLNNYCYVKDNDEDLSSFDLSHDMKQIIPMIKEAYKLSNNELRLLASPWSPPAYMKSNNNMNFGGHLLEKYRSLWAKYYVRYIQEMKNNGVNIDAISVQNEPAATQTWDSCLYSSSDERDFVKYYLHGELVNNGLDYIKVYVWDHNRGDILVNRAIDIFEDKKANKYIEGIAFHWYCSEDFQSLSKFHNLYPNKSILFTEGCVEYGVYGDESKYRFENGEQYAYHMINDFNNYNEGFIDWNLILDSNGGPNHVGNFCEAPIMVDIEKQKIIYNSTYYYIGHFSKYVKRGAKRLLTTYISNNKTIHACAFKNPNDEIVIVILNKGYIENVSLLIDDNKVNLSLPNQSITTFIVK